LARTWGESAAAGILSLILTRQDFPRGSFFPVFRKVTDSIPDFLVSNMPGTIYTRRTCPEYQSAAPAGDFRATVGLISVFLVFMPRISQAGKPERKALRDGLRMQYDVPQAPA
jgi:hypothetical protein